MDMDEASIVQIEVIKSLDEASYFKFSDPPN
jgi:hypothetical protein